MSTHVFTFNRTHTSTFVADNMRNLLRDIITWSGLDPTKLVDDWDVLGNAVRIWLRSGHLYEIVMEFYMPGTSGLVGRWDFPITYDGSGVEDDLWVAREHVRRTIDKAGRPPPAARYTIILRTHSGREDVPGMVLVELRSTSGMVGRSSGTAIATPDIMASLKYW
jgi:hypothetical protein